MCPEALVPAVAGSSLHPHTLTAHLWMYSAETPACMDVSAGFASRGSPTQLRLGGTVTYKRVGTEGQGWGVGAQPATQVHLDLYMRGHRLHPAMGDRAVWPFLPPCLFGV